jgi:septum formation topological specificity factor MinE
LALRRRRLRLNTIIAHDRVSRAPFTGVSNLQADTMSLAICFATF